MESEYKAAWRKFTGDLYEYAESFVYRGGQLAEFGVEFMQTAKACISGYDKESGSFLNYFLKSIATTIKRVRAKQQIANVRNGGKIGKKLNDICRFMFRYADSKGIDVNDESVQNKIAEKLGVPLDKVKEALVVNYKAVPVSNVAINDDGEEVDLFDGVIDKTSSVEVAIDEEDSFAERIEEIEKTYAICRKDTQRTVRYKLTALLIYAFDGDDEKIRAIRPRVTFFTDEVYDFYKREGKVPQDNQLATMLGVVPPSLSRAFHTYKTKLEEVKNERKI